MFHEAEHRLFNGFARLRAIFDRHKDSHEAASLVTEGPLLSLMVNPTGPMDRSIVRRVYFQVYGSDSLEHKFRKLPEYEQLSLFGALK